jgi:hypothetical protein
VGGGGEGSGCAGGSEEVDAGWDGEDYLREGVRIVSLLVGGCKISVCMTVYNNGRPGNLSFLARPDSILQMMGTRKQNYHLLIEIAGTTIFFDSFFNRQAILQSAGYRSL